MSKLKIVLMILFFVLLIPITGLGFLYYHFVNIPNINENKTILIMGKGGEGHTAPNLTDTIMTVNFVPQNKHVSMLSLPRDLWVSSIKAKINTAYHYGGFKMADESVNLVTGLNMNNNVVIDFNIFKEIIDGLGGVDVDVENSFVDNRYPIAGKENDLCGGDKNYSCRYETVKFEKGIVSMNGETALKYVRSRNSQSDEGTDIAREKRQQRLILALKNKVLSPSTLFNVSKIKNLYKIVLNNIETDLSNEDLKEYTKFLVRNNFQIKTVNFPESLISVSKNDKKYDLQYVFLPNDKTWKEVKEWIKLNI